MEQTRAKRKREPRASIAALPPGATGDDRLVAWWDHRALLLGAMNRISDLDDAGKFIGDIDAANDRLHDEVSVMSRAIMTTPAGVVIKLRLALDFADNTRWPTWPNRSESYERCGRDYEQWAVVSAWADAERVAGGPIPKGRTFPPTSAGQRPARRGQGG